MENWLGGLGGSLALLRFPSAQFRWPPARFRLGSLLEAQLFPCLTKMMAEDARHSFFFCFRQKLGERCRVPFFSFVLNSQIKNAFVLGKG